MTRHILLFILPLLLIGCSDNITKADIDSKGGIVDSSTHSNEYSQSADSVIDQYFPIYNNKTESTSKNGPVFQALLDSLLQYKKIREFINDSSASVYIISEAVSPSDSNGESIQGSTRNISAAICNFDKEGCYLQLKFDYSNKSIIVLNSCNGHDSLRLYDWNKKNCW